MPLTLIRLSLRTIERHVRLGVDESEFCRVEREVTLPLQTCALVLVDVWDTHHITSHLRRCERIIDTTLAPLVDSARHCGLQVIHAPGPEVAAHYPQCTSHGKRLPTLWLGQSAPPTPKAGNHPTLPGLPRPDDPPTDVLALRQNRRIAPQVAPTHDERVVADRQQLFQALEASGIETIFYAGFASNICLPYRDYGMRAAQAAGWKVVLVRDATTAVEFAESLDGEKLLAASIADIEMNYGSTTTALALRRALEAQTPSAALR